MPVDAASPRPDTALTVVLVHGLWLGGWSFDAVRERLHADGVPTVAPDLPMRSLVGDVAVVRAALDSVGGPVLLVGHSYGGAVITAAGTHPSVAALVYLAAFLLDDGESVSRVAPGADIAPTGLAEALTVSPDRADVTLDPARVADLLHHRADPATAAATAERLRPVARELFSARPDRFAWRDRPSTYVVCSDDRTVAPALQRLMAERATASLEWDSDHTPQASRPADVAALLAGLATTV